MALSAVPVTDAVNVYVPLIFALSAGASKDTAVKAADTMPINRADAKSVIVIARITLSFEEAL